MTKVDELRDLRDLRAIEKKNNEILETMSPIPGLIVCLSDLT
jgi:hypothetical protein